MTGFASGVAFLVTSTIDAMLGAVDGLLGVVQYVVLPITYLAGGEIDAGYIALAIVWQLSALALLSWITVFALRTFGPWETPAGADPHGATTDGAGMTFLDAVRAVLLEKPLTLSGRAGRAEFWWFLLFQNLVVLGLLLPGFLIIAQGGSDTAGPIGVALVVLSSVAALVFAIPSIAVAIRRLHDIGQSGQSGVLLLLGLVPFGSLALLILLAQPTGPDNRYGPGDNRFGSWPSMVPASVLTQSGYREERAPLPPSGTFAVPAGWLPDPDDASLLRYWDGSGWTASRFRPND